MNTNANTDTESETDSESEHPLTPGDRVVDREQPAADRGVAVVLETGVGPANEVEAGGRPVSEYRTNAGYAADAPVVRVVFEQALDAVDDWREAEDLAARVADFKSRWGAKAVPVYSYPAPRLDRAGEVMPDAE